MCDAGMCLSAAKERKKKPCADAGGRSRDLQASQGGRNDARCQGAQCGSEFCSDDALVKRDLVQACARRPAARRAREGHGGANVMACRAQGNGSGKRGDGRNGA